MCPFIHISRDLYRKHACAKAFGAQLQPGDLIELELSVADLIYVTYKDKHWWLILDGFAADNIDVAHTAR